MEVVVEARDMGLARATEFLERVAQLNARYRAGEMRAYVPEALRPWLGGRERLEPS